MRGGCTNDWLSPTVNVFRGEARGLRSPYRNTWGSWLNPLGCGSCGRSWLLIELSFRAPSLSLSKLLSPGVMKIEIVRAGHYEWGNQNWSVALFKLISRTGHIYLWLWMWQINTRVPSFRRVIVLLSQVVVATRSFAVFSLTLYAIYQIHSEDVSLLINNCWKHIFTFLDILLFCLLRVYNYDVSYANNILVSARNKPDISDTQKHLTTNRQSGDGFWDMATWVSIERFEPTFTIKCHSFLCEFLTRP